MDHLFPNTNMTTGLKWNSFRPTTAILEAGDTSVHVIHTCVCTSISKVIFQTLPVWYSALLYWDLLSAWEALIGGVSTVLPTKSTRPPEHPHCAKMGNPLHPSPSREKHVASCSLAQRSSVTGKMEIFIFFQPQPQEGVRVFSVT